MDYGSADPEAHQLICIKLKCIKLLKKLLALIAGATALPDNIVP